ncbi:hypothetical protein SCP_0507930 [Sparassis crispa]|uniref:NAD(P)-binding protein n=1 Tax=Sparassis crispa TaxID=139825 RepID=A0A401GND0_9APHY|nr:hypothetical protein SCP_0507930 [Sparassis crispa]GBE83737.1 hypothetical protein SCP_0507930 [Sparassis crispa]
MLFSCQRPEYKTRPIALVLAQVSSSMIIPFDKISIIGVRSTGFNMAMRFTENGLRVISALDVKGENVDNLSTVWCHGLDPKHHQQVYIQGLPQLHQQSRRRQGTQAVGPQRSTWWRGRQIFEQSREHLTMGDIILDGANWCEHTERRGKELQPRGVSYISMGVSGYLLSVCTPRVIHFTERGQGGFGQGDAFA